MKSAPSKLAVDRRKLRRFERNIKAVYASATLGEIEAGASWYAVARSWCYTVAARYHLPVRTVAAVVCALSPRNKWNRNLIDAENVIRAWRNGGRRDSVTVATFHGNRAKAWKILQLARPELVESSPKTRAFLSNITEERSTAVTIDVHARCVCENIRKAGDQFVTLTDHVYGLMVQAYRNAAAELGIEYAYQLQAICWVAWKGKGEK